MENIFQSVNIALVNELTQLCDRLGTNVWGVVDAASTKPFGFIRDQFYLEFKVREHDFYRRSSS